MLKRLIALATTSAFVAAGGYAQAQAPKTIKVQSTWSPGFTLQDHLRTLAERVEKLTAGSVKIDAMSAGQVVPAFEVLDATNKKVIDGYHAISYYWSGKSRIRAARIARSAQSSRRGGLVRRSTATSCRRTSSSAFLEADDRPSRTSQPQSRMKTR